MSARQVKGLKGETESKTKKGRASLLWFCLFFMSLIFLGGKNYGLDFRGKNLIHILLTCSEFEIKKLLRSSFRGNGKIKRQGQSSLVLPFFYVSDFFWEVRIMAELN